MSASVVSSPYEIFEENAFFIEVATNTGVDWFYNHDGHHLTGEATFHFKLAIEKVLKTRNTIITDGCKTSGKLKGMPLLVPSQHNNNIFSKHISRPRWLGDPIRVLSPTQLLMELSSSTSRTLANAHDKDIGHHQKDTVFAQAVEPWLLCTTLALLHNIAVMHFTSKNYKQVKRVLYFALELMEQEIFQNDYQKLIRQTFLKEHIILVMSMHFLLAHAHVQESLMIRSNLCNDDDRKDKQGSLDRESDGSSNEDSNKDQKSPYHNDQDFLVEKNNFYLSKIKKHCFEATSLADKFMNIQQYGANIVLGQLHSLCGYCTIVFDEPNEDDDAPSSTTRDSLSSTFYSTALYLYDHHRPNNINDSNSSSTLMNKPSGVFDDDKQAAPVA